MKTIIPIIVTLLFAWQGFSQSKIDSIRPKADVKWDTLSMEYKRDAQNYKVETRIIDSYKRHDSLNSTNVIFEIKGYLIHPDGTRKLKFVSKDTMNDGGGSHLGRTVLPKSF